MLFARRSGCDAEYDFDLVLCAKHCSSVSYATLLEDVRSESGIARNMCRDVCGGVLQYVQRLCVRRPFLGHEIGIGFGVFKWA